MAEILTQLADGLSNAATVENILFALVGALIGTIVGALPGVGPSAAIALLLPLIFGMNDISAMIMLAGVYLGAMYGGTITSVLLNVPGESSSVMTAVEGYRLAQRGKAGATLVIAAVGSFFAGVVSVTLLAFFAPPLARAALAFGPPEYFVLILLGLFSLTLLGSSSFSEVALSGMAGLLLATIGIDPMRGVDRFTLGLPFFVEGVSFIIVTVGMFGMGEVLASADRPEDTRVAVPKLKELYPSVREIWSQRWPIMRGTGIGFILGILPGSGANLASFMSYAAERKLSKTPEKFGTEEGVMEGVAAPEASNNASTGGALIPMFALGIPGSGVTAVLLAGMLILGLRPGPLLFDTRPDFAWAVIASLYISNVALLALNWPLVPMFSYILRVPYTYLYPAILVFVLVGAYSVHFDMFGVWLVIVFGVLGFMFSRLKLPIAPLVLALVLGPLFERSLVQSLTISRGDPLIFITRPVSGGLLALLVLIIVIPKIVGRARSSNSDEYSAFDD